MTTFNDKQAAKNFFDEWIGAKGPKGWVSRYLSNTGRWYTQMLISEGEISQDDLVLDVGCGSATMIINLLKKLPLKNPVYGIDPSDAQFELAKRNVATEGLTDKVFLKQSFASPLPFEDNFFDVVYSSFILKHFADDTLTNFFKEAHRVLKPGGRFLGWEFEKITGRIFKNVAKESIKAMKYLRNFEGIKGFLEEAGFKQTQEFKVKSRGFWDFAQSVGFKAVK